MVRLGSPATVAWLVVLTLGISGCPRRLPEFGPAPHEEAQEVLDAVRARQAAPHAIIADARVRAVTPVGRGAADHFVVAERPGNLRLETLSFFGNPLALVLVDADRFLLWEIEAGRAWTGPPTAESLGMLLPIDLEPDAVVALLLGTPPLYDVRHGRLDLDHERRRYVVSLREGERWQQVVVHPQTDLVEEVRWIGPGEEVTGRLFYERWREAETGWFPYEIRYETAETTLRVLYRDVTFDPDPPSLEGLFQVDLPPHVQVVPVEPGRPPPVILPEEIEPAPGTPAGEDAHEDGAGAADEVEDDAEVMDDDRTRRW